jgi:hypothetical protein
VHGILQPLVLLHLLPVLALKRLGLASAAALLAVNMYTGVPLLSIWLGSRVQEGSTLTMTTVMVVIGTLVVGVAIILSLLHRVSAAYDRASGKEQKRQTATWMRSMRDERHEFSREKRELSGVEKAMVAAVVVGVAGFEVWFFFFAGSSIGNG